MFLTGCLEENSHLPAKMMAGPRAASALQVWRKQRPIFRRTHGAPRLYCRGLCRASCLDWPHPALIGGFLGDKADLEKQSVRWPHGCLEVPRVFVLFLLLRNNGITMASVASVWAPPPPQWPLFNPPLRVIAPSLTACVRRAPDTKGGVSRFSEHFTSIHQRRNKSESPLYLREGGGWALPSPPKRKPFPGGGGDHIVFHDHGANEVPDYFYLQRQYICIKIGFFCPLRRAKRKLSQEPQSRTHEGKGRKKFPKTNKVSRWTLNYY